MGEATKEIAIAFAWFCMENSCQDLNTDNNWVSNKDYKDYTDNEFYELFKKQTR